MVFPQATLMLNHHHCSFRAILDLEYLTYQEFAYLLWSMVDNGKSYTESINFILNSRNSVGIEVPTEAQKYVDCKPIMMLVRWNFLSISEKYSMVL